MRHIGPLARQTTIMWPVASTGRRRRPRAGLTVLSTVVPSVGDKRWRPYSSVASVRLGFEPLHPHAQAGAAEAPLGTDLEGGDLVASSHPVHGLAIDVQQCGDVLGREDLRLVRRDSGGSALLATMA